MADRAQDKIQVAEKQNGGQLVSVFDEVSALLHEPFPTFSIMGEPFFFPRRSLFAHPWFRRGAGKKAEMWAPKIDVSEKDGQLLIKADLPGVKKQNITVSLEGEHLIVQATREEEKETKEANYYRSERESGEYYRAIPMPASITEDAISASYEDGVLEVVVRLPQRTLPKAAKPIEIKAK